MIISSLIAVAIGLLILRRQNRRATYLLGSTPGLPAVPESPPSQLAVDRAGDVSSLTPAVQAVLLRPSPFTPQRIVLNGHRDAVWFAMFARTGRHVMTGGMDDELRFWDLARGESVATGTAGAEGVTSVACFPGSPHAVVGSLSGKLLSFESLSSSPTVIDGHPGSVYAVAGSPDGTQFASAGADGIVRVWSTATNSVVRTLAGHAGHVYALAFLSNTELASAGEDGTVRRWDLSTGGELESLLRNDLGQLRALALAPDRTRFAVAGTGGLRILNLANPGEFVPCPDHTDWVRAVAFSPDGTRLASGSVTD